MKIVKNNYIEYTPLPETYVRGTSYNWTIQMTEYVPRGGTIQVSWILSEDQFRALAKSMVERIEKEDAEKAEAEND